MELTINEKQYVFIFGYRFIKELNKKNEVTERGMTLKAGLDNALMNFFSGDIETLVEMLKTANATENPRVSEK
ncbi:tail assembly chaperone, partial [Lactococcus cremoris]